MRATVPSNLVRIHGFGLDARETALLRGPPPAAARQWLRDELGPDARIVSVRPRSGGTSSAIHVVTVDDPSGERRHLVLRRYVRADWLELEPDLAEHEARVLALLDSTAVLAPRLVAVDPGGTRCDVPAVLMTHRPGRVRWSARDVPEYLEQLVDQLLPIHSVRVPPSAGIRDFLPYYVGWALEPPAGTSCPAAWERAIAVHAGPPPVHERDFIHRDYHPGNALWTGTGITGIVDWATASVGSPEADVGHCRINLARHLGHGAAEIFAARYRARSGRGECHPYWDIVAAVGLLDDADPDWLPALDDFVHRATARL
jgi:aminoglycoside phosphotransferase (APT) family kinase protein